MSNTMFLDEKKKKPSVLLIYLIIFVAFIIWVLLDKTDAEEMKIITVEIELPRDV